jgi:hypothetical protein
MSNAILLPALLNTRREPNVIIAGEVLTYLQSNHPIIPPTIRGDIESTRSHIIDKAENSNHTDIVRLLRSLTEVPAILDIMLTIDGKALVRHIPNPVEGNTILAGFRLPALPHHVPKNVLIDFDDALWELANSLPLEGSEGTVLIEVMSVAQVIFLCRL